MSTVEQTTADRAPKSPNVASPRAPNFFIIGAQKCGTTALAEYLSEHPQVFVSELKEPMYWSSDLALPQGDSLYAYPKTREEYLRLFRSATDSHQAVGEASTTYLRSETAVADILRFDPQAKFIVMLRKPREVVYAMHTTNLLYLNDTVSDFETAWRMHDQREASGELQRNPMADYRTVGKLGTQLARFFALVPPEQRHVIVFDDFAADTKATYEGVLRFLGVESDGRTHFPRANESRLHNNHPVARFLVHPPKPLEYLIRTVRPIVRGLGLRALRAKLFDKFTVKYQRPKLSPALETELNDVYRDEVNLLSRLLDRDLSHWAT